MTEPKVTIYGASWCPDCQRSKKFLEEQFIPNRWVNIEQDKHGENYFLQRNAGKRIIPLVLFEEDTFLVEPTNPELARKLGGEPAGLSAQFMPHTKARQPPFRCESSCEGANKEEYGVKPSNCYCDRCRVIRTFLRL
jgi:glutaredoxin